MGGVDWRWRHGTVSGPLHATIALATAYEVGTLPVLDVSPEWVLIGGATAAGVTSWRAAHDGRSWLGLGYRIAGISGSTLWLAQAVTTGWTATLGWTLAAGAVTAAGLARPIRARDRVVAERHAAQEAAASVAAVDAAEQERLTGIAGEWVTRIERVTQIVLRPLDPRTGKRPPVQQVVVAVEHWMFPGPGGVERCTGYTLELVLPTTGVTWQTLSNYQDNLAAAADLPQGCGVEIGPGRSRRRALIEVSIVDALRDDIALPLPTEPRTINNPIPVGVVRNGAQADVPLRYSCAVLVGATGSGKSNELQTIVAGLLSCHDVLVLVIDYNGGGVALPWLSPWVDGTIARSPILWVADNEHEAIMMCDWLIAAIEHRKRAYHAANQARDDDKLAATPATPQLVLVTDEAGATGREVTKRIAQISDRGRAAAVRTVTCALRALSEYIPTEVLAQAQVRIGMKVNDRKELGYLYDWAGGRGGPSPEDAPHTGYGHVRSGQEPPRVFKGYRTSPSMIRAVAVAQDAWRPELDEVTLRMSAEWQRVFEERWQRSAHLLAAAGGRMPVPSAGGGSPERRERQAPTGRGALPPTPPDGPDAGSKFAGLNDALADLDAAAERLRNATPDTPAGPRDDAADAAAFEAIVAYEVVVPELVVRVLAAMGSAERMHTRQIAEKIGSRAESLGGLLSQLDIRPLKSDFTVDGRRGRGYERAEVEAAAERIRSGELVPPEEVARWRPDAPA
ncbi:FtsK/SpoIIIE domain-containing protein [Actinomadura litoris]|uniref:FtsK domain-containing protein n=1 Tax=Actinomadura litoris TaxID=2678616 RepID=A0A7K1LAI8_9ACTN|nr:FtsK/SpoIIIE domain-containing protein [Actinomadura litoris]MUN41442.1 hypothetical protein [Actinomadura litoris]